MPNTPSRGNPSDVASNRDTEAVSSAEDVESPAVGEKKIGYTATTYQIATGGSVIFVGRAVGIVCRFVIETILARFLGAAGYGLYALGFAVSTIARKFSKLELQSGMVRFGALYLSEEDPSKVKGTILAASTLALASSAIITVGLYLGSGWISERIFDKPELTRALQIFSLSLILHTVMVITQFAARIFRNMRDDVLIQDISRPLANIVLIGLMLLLGYGLIGMIGAFLGSLLVASILGLYLLRRSFPPLFSGSKARYSVRPLLSYSFAVSCVEMLYLMLWRTDKLMTGYFLPFEQVGIYNSAERLVWQIGIFVTLFNPIFYPISSELFNKGRLSEVSKLYTTTTKWTFTASLPAFLVFALYPRQLLHLFFGQEYVAGADVLVILGLAQFVLASSGLTNTVLHTSGRQKLDMLNNLIGLGVSVSLNYMFIKSYGMIGAALATMLTLLLIRAAQLIEIKLLLGFQPYTRYFGKPLLAASACIGVHFLVSWLGISWIIGALALPLVYGASLFALGFEAEDRALLGMLWSKLAHRNSSTLS